ncbi:MAG: electron transfer flavoprotein subunit beta/FixA family protein [Bacteroidales bacterium]|nr:electron transfer flavoprotein subunit beta/FixA family protein [Bacteroidales bacterium]
MNILVCISNVPDTTTKVRFKDNNTAFDDTGVQWIINPWDELALTRALELKEKSNGAIESITVANVGPKVTEQTIRKALAVGADKAIRVDAEPKDASYVATQLAEVVKNGSYDIIMNGIESSDYNGSSVGSMLAELLDYPSVSSVTSLDIENDEVKLVREIAGGKESVETELPFVAVVQKGIATDPRIPAMRGIMMARKKPMEVLQPVDAEPLTDFVEFEMPEPKGECRMVEPGNEKELIELLHNEAKVI